MESIVQTMFGLIELSTNYSVNVVQQGIRGRVSHHNGIQEIQIIVLYISVVCELSGNAKWIKIPWKFKQDDNDLPSCFTPTVICNITHPIPIPN